VTYSRSQWREETVEATVDRFFSGKEFANYWVDCNCNGYQDMFDIEDGRSHDANNNGIPDECEGGGGGEGCPLVETRTGQGWQMDGGLLASSATSASSLDVCRLRRIPSQVDGRVGVRLRASVRGHATLDNAR